jgi:hypothetical protein
MMGAKTQGSRREAPILTVKAMPTTAVPKAAVTVARPPVVPPMTGR